MGLLQRIAASAVALLSAIALGGVDLTERVSLVGDILGARVAQIDAAPEVTKAEKKEARRLVAAGKKLLKYSGDDTKKSLKKAALAVKLIAKAKSDQQDVSQCVDELLDALEGVATTAREDALSYTWPAKSCRDKHGSAISRGDVLMGRSSSKRATRPGKAASLAVSATSWYWKARELAAKCADSSGPEVFITGTRLWNMSDDDLRIDDIVFEFSGWLGGEPLDYSGRAATQLPGSFPMQLDAGTSRDIFPLVLAILASEPTLPKWQLGDVINAHMTLKTSKGDFDVGY